MKARLFLLVVIGSLLGVGCRSRGREVEVTYRVHGMFWRTSVEYKTADGSMKTETVVLPWEHTVIAPAPFHASMNVSGHGTKLGGAGPVYGSISTAQGLVDEEHADGDFDGLGVMGDVP